MTRAAAKRFENSSQAWRLLALAAIRWRDAGGRREDRRHDCADRSRLGDRINTVGPVA